MYELPASVRLSLWLTHAFRFGRDVRDAVSDALPDVDDVAGDVDRVQVWRDLGERAVCVDLPHHGVLGGLLPPASQAMTAALETGECLFVPSLGGALVPRLEIYGPPTDEGLRVVFEAHDSEPVPAHRLGMLSLPDIDRRFREAMLREVSVLEQLDIQPFGASSHRARAENRLADAQWALPPGLPSRALRIITTAGLVTAAIDSALGTPAGHDARTQLTRDEPLRRLLGEVQLAMAEAATYAALDLADMH